ncbi:SURF1 family cytochrome oxidase biogenesis protein [Pseudolysinimonas sp.]|uniref:SURF1 family cytochrome oxidase biogenesis protein n=1 Tax=Pseudolysinimonas sp. TaxID=2680009 RepID=UPI003F80F901
MTTARPRLDEPMTFGRVARRPRWIAALILALALAAGFAWLGQWQLGRSIASAPTTGPDTEKVVPLTSFAKPGVSFRDDQIGRMASVDATLVPGDTVLLSDRLNGGVTGWWVVGHAVTANGTDLAVALGWAPTRSAARAAEPTATIPTPLIGRYLPSESPDQPTVEKGVQSASSVPAFINQWQHYSGEVYPGYLVARTPSAGLDRIDSPKPIPPDALNWLNLFYAIEWAVFAGFAIYLWYRLVQDVVEKENGDDDPTEPSDSDQ